MKPLFTTCLLFLALCAAHAVVFQYSVPVKTANDESRAFLWIPPDASRVRGVVVAGGRLWRHYLGRRVAGCGFQRQIRADALVVRVDDERDRVGSRVVSFNAKKLVME